MALTICLEWNLIVSSCHQLFPGRPEGGGPRATQLGLSRPTEERALWFPPASAKMFSLVEKRKKEKNQQGAGVLAQRRHRRGKRRSSACPGRGVASAGSQSPAALDHAASSLNQGFRVPGSAGPCWGQGPPLPATGRCLTWPRETGNSREIYVEGEEKRMTGSDHFWNEHRERKRMNAGRTL